MEKITYTISKEQWNRIDNILGHLAKAYSQAIGDNFRMKLMYDSDKKEHGIFFYRQETEDDEEVQMYLEPCWIGEPENMAEILETALDILRDNLSIELG